MKNVFTDTDLDDSYQDDLHSMSDLNSTLKKCQSLILLQKKMIKKNDSKNENDKNLANLNDLDVDLTKKENEDVINSRIRHFFNVNNYEQSIKKEAWKKDISKMFLGLNNNNANIDGIENNNENEYAELPYNFEDRERKKEGLIFLKNFFGQMKSIKNKFKKKDKSKETPLKLNKYEKYYFQDKIKKKITDEEINFILYKLRQRYSPKKIKNEKEKKIRITNTLTEVNNINNNNNLKLRDKIRFSNLKKNNIHNSKIHLNKLQRFDTENNFINNKNFNNINNKIKNLFPLIKSNSEFEKNRYNTIDTDHHIRKVTFKNLKKNELKNIRSNISDRSIFNKNKGFNRSNTYLDQLRQIYKSKSKKKFKTLDNKNDNNKNNINLVMPRLLKYKEKPLIKRDNQLFFSPLHYYKVEQMKEIRNKLIGIFDKEVFTVYNQNI